MACVHLFGIMIVNNWNTFYYSYQTVFGFEQLSHFQHVSISRRSLLFCRREIFLYFLTFYFFIVVVTYSLLVSSSIFSLPSQFVSAFPTLSETRSRSSWKRFSFTTRRTVDMMDLILRRRKRFAPSASLRLRLCMSFGYMF